MCKLGSQRVEFDLQSKMWTMINHELRAPFYAVTYAAWILVFRLLVLTFITYFLISSNSRFQDISEAYGANEISLMGLSSLLYLVFLTRLNPLTSTTFDVIFTPQRFERRFAPGFLHGAVLALALTLALLLTGLYKYLGFLIQIEEAPLAVASILIRIATLGTLVYCEEFIFRQKILNYFRRWIPDFTAVLVTAIVYCIIKGLQFDLGLMHYITLFLVSVNLGLKSMIDGDFTRGAGFWAAILIVLHPFLSLPVFGSDFQGIVLVKFLDPSESGTQTFRVLTGGAGGPLSSFLLQLIFAIDIAQHIFKNKKVLWNRKIHRLK